jgi:pimeloyl-ACP methyl ester carboxylesterase
MHEEINNPRRRFFTTAALTIAAAQLNAFAEPVARTASAKTSASTATPETNTSFGPLKQIDAEGPVIAVPTITMEGDANGAPHPEPSAYAKKFTGKHEHRAITGGVGHNLPQEAPQAFAQAVIDADRL